MAKLKGVIFGWDNVLVAMGKLAPNKPILDETGKLVRFLQKNGIEVVVLTNRKYVVKDGTTGNETPAKEYFDKAWGVSIDWHLCGQNGGAGKQSYAGFQAVLDKKVWKANNAVYVGNSKDDMLAAVNNSVLLLTAKWYPDTTSTTEYGFHFDDPKGIARFIDVFCLRGHHWYYRIDDGPLQMYALAPLNTFHDTNKYHCEDFLANVKSQYANDDEFWAKFLCTSMYFSGVYETIKFITAYPKHEKGKYQTVLVKPMDTFAKSFGGKLRRRYIPDLIERHTTAIKSQYNRPILSHLTQLDSIRLNANPTKLVKGRVETMKFPIKPGETVLVIDDVCTEGYSFEAARLLFETVGVKVINVAFLKTPSNDYKSIASATLIQGAFGINKGVSVKAGKIYPYRSHIVDVNAPTELTARLKRYQSWDWPT